MYLHIGGDKVVDDEEILLILPRETVMHSYDNRRFMETVIGSGRGTTYPAASGTHT